MAKDNESPLDDESIAFWQRKAGRPFSTEDSREINRNLTGFFRLLAKWAEEARQNVNELGSVAKSGVGSPDVNWPPRLKQGADKL